MDWGALLGAAALITALGAVYRNWSQRSLNRSEEAVNWEAIANRATTALVKEREEHAGQLEELQRTANLDSERLDICEQRWTLVSPLLKTWANGRLLESQIVDKINQLTARAETLRVDREGT